MATYPGSNQLVTLAEVKAYTGLTSASDAFITSLIPAVTNAIETHCDRRLLKWQWQCWYSYDRALILNQWPVNNILFLGTPVAAIQVTDSANTYSFNIVQQNGTNPSIVAKLTVTDGFTLTSTDFLFSTYTTLAALKVAVVAAFPALTLDIATSPTYNFDAMNTLCLRGGTGTTWYGAIRQNVLYRIDDETSRTLIIPQNVIVQFNALDYWFETSLCVIWDAGYETATVPYGLKLTASNICNDIINITKLPSAGLVKSEQIKNYSYSLFDNARIYALINDNYLNDLQPYVKKLC